MVYKQKQNNNINTLKGGKRPHLAKHNTFLYILRLKTNITITLYGSLVRSLFSQCSRIAIRKLLSVYVRTEQLNKYIFRKALIKSKDVERVSKSLRDFQAQFPRIVANSHMLCFISGV